VILTATGVSGVMAYAVSRRVREIGIRIALGASSTHVLRLVLSRAVLLVTVGTLVGLVLALAAGRLFTPILYQVSATDPATYILTIALLAAIATIACIVPARRAVRVDPAVAFRAE
jgi:ABC-type antimicrobial peptide transport system permease subunit